MRKFAKKRNDAATLNTPEQTVRSAHSPVPRLHSILQLQRAIGNGAVLRRLQSQQRDSIAKTQSEAHQVPSSSGQPLEPAAREIMESRLGHDFSQVRVHTDASAAKSAQSLSASAYTAGDNIVFGPSQYQPLSASGQRLLAHELTHVVQQRAGVDLPAGMGQKGDRYERLADAVAERVTHPGTAHGLLASYPQTTSAASPGGIAASPVQRQSHESQGYGVKDDAGSTEKITRPEQVLSTYGITCYGTSVMFMLQSYGLVPPDMTREEFEYAFTPLNPKSDKHSDPKTDDIQVAGKTQSGAKPVDLITEALQGTSRPPKSDTSLGKVTFTEATLRGADKGSFTVKQIMEHMPKILAAFNAQSAKKGYEFMKAHVPVSGKPYAASAGENWIESSKELSKGTIPADYFKDGNTIMTGVTLSFPPASSLDHWVVIVKEPDKREIDGKPYFLYPADDPLFGEAYVMAPGLEKADKIDKDTLEDADLSRKYGELKYNGHRVHTFLNGNAFRRNVKKTP